MVNEDPRMSCDFSSQDSMSSFVKLNNHQNKMDNFINRTQYNPQLYQRPVEYSGYDLNSKSVYNPNMSTMRFMTEIDLRCDDHLLRLKEDWQADRYCSECKILCCDSCVIEYHNQHIQEAKTKIEDFFKKQKNELEDLKSKVMTSIKQKTALNELHNVVETNEKSVLSFFMKRKNFLENLKIKIESLLADENDLCNKMKENLQIFYREECFRRMDKPLKDMESLSIRLQTFLRDWEIFSRIDKARALKSDQVTIFKSESEDLNNSIKNSIELFRNKSNALENNLMEIFKNFSYNDKLDQMESILLDISTKVKSNFSLTNKINFDELNIDNLKINSNMKNNNFNSNKSQEVGSLIKNQNSNDGFNLLASYNSNFENDSNIKSNIQLPLNNLSYPQQINTNQSEKQNYSNFPQGLSTLNSPPQIIIPNYEYSASSYNYSQPTSNYNSLPNKFTVLSPQNNLNRPPSYTNIVNKNEDSKDLIIPLLDKNTSYELQNSNNSSFNFLQQNQFNYDLVIGVKPKSDEIIVYDPRGPILTNLKITPSLFQDPQKAFTTFHDNSKYVNLGFSILLTGGYLNKQMSNACFLIVLCKKEKSNGKNSSFDISVMSYSNMLEARERHNILHLSDRNLVMVCSGFFSNTAEMTDVNSGVWKSLPKLNDVRANASIAYVNRRFVWMFGGFKINESKIGVYLNSCEVLDLDNLNKGWILFNNQKLGFNFQLSAMGIINIEENSILICGGYDGTQYKKDVHKIYTHETEIIKVEKFNNSLPGNYIFLHNNFVRVDTSTYNYDFQMNLIKYDTNDFSFKLHK
jgi:hypothetical protein